MDKTELEQKKEYLRSYRKTKTEAKSIQDSIDELRLNKMSPSMGNQDGMPRGNGSSDLSGYAARLDELERKLRAKKKLAMLRMIEIANAIGGMENATERTILRYRYICGYTWEKIAGKMGFSERWIHKIHGKSLKSFKIPK